MFEGNSVVLRAVEESDLSQLMEWRNNPKYRKFFREYRELNSSMQRNWFDKFVMNDPNTRMFSIVEKKTGRLLGACGLCYINWIFRSADFSIYIGADNIYIDDYYALDAAQLMMRYAFNELNMHRLWSEIYDFDERKEKMFTTLGFTLDGRHRETYWYDGKWHDSLFYGVLIHEWKQ